MADRKFTVEVLTSRTVTTTSTYQFETTSARSAEELGRAMAHAEHPGAFLLDSTATEVQAPAEPAPSIPEYIEAATAASTEHFYGTVL